MTQHDAFNQGFYDTARQHAGQSPVLSELDAINKRANEYEASKRSAVTTYQPGPVIEYAPPAPKPYANDAEAIKDLKDGFGQVVVWAAPRVVGLSVVGGVGYVIVSFFQGLAATAVATGATLAAPAVGVSTLAYVGGAGLVAAFALFCLSGLKNDGNPKQAAPGAINQATQNINVVVNISGNGVTATTNGK